MRALTGHEVEPTLTMREARAGDRYLLCSDGLSDPVSDETILEALQIPDVAESAYRLIELALRGGGPDNVTVVVADVVDYDYGQTQPILAGAVSGEDDQQLTLPNTAAGRASAISPRKEAAKRVPPQVEAATRPRWSRRRMAIVIALVVLLVLAGLAIGRCDHPEQLLRRRIQRHGVDRAGNSGSLLGISLHEPYLVGLPQRPQRAIPDQLRPIRGSPRLPPMTLQDLSPAERAQVQAGLPGGTLDQAESQLRKLLANSLLPACPPPRATSPPGPSTPPRAGHQSQASQHPPPPPAPPSHHAPPAPPHTAPPTAPATTVARAPPQTVTALPPHPTGAGHSALPGGGMTTQLQPPVAVTPPLPTRRNAELLLLCFAAVITVAALLIVEANQQRGLRWDLTGYGLVFLVVFGRRASGR